MKTKRQQRPKRQEKRMKNILIQIHSFILNLVLCLGLYSAHLPLSYAADSESNLDQLIQNAANSGASQSDLTTSSAAPTAATGATAASIAKHKAGTKVTGKDVDTSPNMLMSNIGLMAAGLVAPSVIMTCQSQISAWIYMGSALVYLANEVGLFTKLKNGSNKEMAAYLGRGDEDKQIVSLETAAKQTEDAQKAADKRAMIATIAASGFTAAAVMSVVEGIEELYTPGVGTCIGAGDGGAGSAVPVGVPLQWPPVTIVAYDLDKNLNWRQDPLKGASFEITQQIEPANLNFNSDNFDLMVSYLEQAEFLKGKTQSITIDEYQQKRHLIADDLNRLTGLKSAFMALAKLTAEALTTDAIAAGTKDSSNIAALGLGAAALTLIPPVATTISSTINNPWPRAAVFGVVAGFGWKTSSDDKEAAKKLAERSQEYRKLAISLKSQVAQNASNKHSLQNQTISAIGSNKGSGEDNPADFCISNKTTVKNIAVNPSCSCVKDNSCKKTKLPDISKMPKFAGQSLLTDTMKSLKSAGDNVYAGNLKGAATQASSLSKKAARINRLRDALVKKINADNIAAGGKGNLDIKALENKISDSMLRKVNSAFNKLSPSQRGTLGRFAPALSDSNTKMATNKKKNNKGSAAVGGTGKIATGSAGSKSSTGSGFNLDFNDDNEDTKADPEAEALAQAMAQEDDNYLIEGDINDDRSKDIFKIITGRYLKSAYPVIFKEE